VAPVIADTSPQVSVCVCMPGGLLIRSNT
jgi:hypothetical protein